MQTFLPYDDFALSAKCLDRQRLGKQRLECVQLLGGGWPNHPASILWLSDTLALRGYFNALTLEWLGRGYRNNMRLFDEALDKCPMFHTALHSSHRANLLRKDTEHYGQFGWEERPHDFYAWRDCDGRWYWQQRGVRRRHYVEA